MYLERPDFIKLISRDADISLHQAENVLNAIFGHLKTMLSEATINAVADDLKSGDLKTVWLTAKLAENEELEIRGSGIGTEKVKRWH